MTGVADAISQATKILRSSALTPNSADLLSSQLVTRLGIGQGLGLITRFGSMTESVKEQSASLLAVGQQLGLQGAIYSSGDEADLWQKLREQMGASITEPVITCKIGVLPSSAIATLNQIDSIAPQQVMGLIHTGSGLGLLALDSTPSVKAQTILEMRSLCQGQSGFLTVLEAPTTLKQQMDVWGYSGNALELMRQIKQQFDPENILSSHRFVV